MNGNNGFEMQMCLEPLVCFFFYSYLFLLYTKCYSKWLLQLEPQWWQQLWMTTPTPTLATMNGKQWGSRFITSQAPGTIAMSPCHCSTSHPHFHHHLHTLAFTSEVSPILKSLSSTSQKTSTMIVCSLLASSHHLSIAPNTTPTSYLKGKFPHLFFFIFYILIILSTRSTATTPPHHHYQYQPTPNEIGSRRVCVSSLRFFFFFFSVLMFIYCHHQTCHNGHHILMIATSPPHQYTQRWKGLDLLLEMYLKPLVGFFFSLFFMILTFIYLFMIRPHRLILTCLTPRPPCWHVQPAPQWPPDDKKGSRIISSPCYMLPHHHLAN